MTDKHILHMLTPLKHMSPFDVNMALDAGYDAAIAYTNVMLDEVGGLVQDAIFSRPPKTGVRTGMFIGGKNAILALDMLVRRQEGAGTAIRHLILCRPCRFVHHRGGHGGVRREVVARQEEAKFEGPETRGLRCDRRGRLLLRRHCRSGRRRRHPCRLRRHQTRERSGSARSKPASRSTSMSPMAATIRRRRRSWQRPRPHSARDARACAFSRALNLPKRSVF